MPGSWSSGWECSPPDCWGHRAVRGAPTARVRRPRGVHALAYAGLVSSSGKGTEWGSHPLGCFRVCRDAPPAPASWADTRGPAGAATESGWGRLSGSSTRTWPPRSFTCARVSGGYE